MLTPLGPGITQPNIRDIFQYGKTFSHSTPEIAFNYHQNTHFTNHTYQITQNNGNAHHSMTIRTWNTSHDHQVFHNRSSLSCGLFNGNFSHKHLNNHLHSPNLILNYLGVTLANQVGKVVNGTRLLASVMMDQPIIQPAITSLEIKDDNKTIWSIDRISWKCSTNFLSRHLTNSIFKNVGHLST